MEITINKTVAEIVSKYKGSDNVFSKYSIDFCCGGGATLEAVCKESGIEFETLKSEIETINNKIENSSSLSDLDIGSLMQKAENDYLKTIVLGFNEILPLASKVSDVHGQHHIELIEIDSLVQNVKMHINEVFKGILNGLYPAINDILNLDNSSSEVSSEQVNALKEAINANSSAKSSIADIFSKISSLSSNYAAPEDACNSYRFLYSKLQQLEHDAHKFLHFEKHVLNPKALNIIE